LAGSGESALEIVSDYEPDLLLLDVVMPGLTGFETFEGIRLLTGCENIPGIFVLAKGSSPQLSDNLVDILGVVPKPFDLATLSDQVSELWNSR
jgi:two-component system, OmpR family, response regulator